ncbi:hypothetical protein D9M68_660810 [compost metagenome]
MTREREVLAKRVPDETIVGQDAAQVVVTFEHDAVEVKRLAFVPVGRCPECTHGVDDREVVFRAEHPHPQPLVQADRQQVHHRSKTRTFPTTVAVGLVVHATQINHLLKPRFGRVTQGLHHRKIVGRSHHQSELFTLDIKGYHALTQQCSEGVFQRVGIGGVKDGGFAHGPSF